MSDYARAYLSPVPGNEPRPTAYTNEVIQSVIKPNLAELQAWLQYRVPDLTDDIVTECAAHGIVSGRGDGFGAALALRDEVNWPADAHLVMIFHKMCAAIPVAIRQAERNWQLRTGIRFPAEKNDTIEWYDTSNRRFTGVVQSIDKANAVAFVQPLLGKMNQGAPRRVSAEWVTQNRSRVFDERQLGFSIVDASEVELT